MEYVIDGAIYSTRVLEIMFISRDIHIFFFKTISIPLRDQSP